MKVFDPRNLVDERLIENVTKHHPLNRDMASELNLVSIEEKTDRNIHVHMDEGNNVQLVIPPMIRPTERDLYILYHEFGHVADRLNPDFHYDHDTRLNLSFGTEKSLLVLWNVFIDTRLNKHGLFRLPAGGEVEITVDGVRYRLPRNDKSTYLLEAVAGLSSRGVQKPGAKVTAIWNHPDRFLSFSDLLDMV